jgi:hypothetical protein
MNLVGRIDFAVPDVHAPSSSIPITPVMRILLPRLGYAPLFCMALAMFASDDLSPYVWGDDPPKKPTVNEDDVLDWIDDLDASSLAKRKSAEAALIEAGEPVLEFLPASDKDSSIEVAERIKRIREAIGKEVAKAESQTQAIEIRLNEVSTVGEALDAISRDSGIEFETEMNLDQPVESVPAPLSFWHAVDLVLDQAKLDLNFYGGDRETLQLVPREPTRPSRVDSAAYAGVYRIEPTSVTSRRALQTPNLSGLNISLEIAWQPGMTPIGLTVPVKQLIGRLDDGTLLRPQVSGEQIDIATTADLSMSEFFVPMQLPAGRPQKISAISGIIRALLPGPTKKFEIKSDSADRSATAGSMTVNIEEIRPNGPLHEFRVAISLENAGRALESHRQWIYENEAYLLLADGTRADHLGYEVYRSGNAGVGIGYLFDVGDSYKGTTLIYQSPTSVVPNEVAFVIQDIPLP